MQIEELSKKLKKGDGTTIAGMLGYSVSYVNQVLDPNNVRTNKRIEDVASKLVKLRENLAKEIQLNETAA